MNIKSFSLDVRFGPAVTCRVLLNGVTVTQKRSRDAEGHPLAIQHEVMPVSNRIEFLIGNHDPSPDRGAGVPVPVDPAFFVEAVASRRPRSLKTTTRSPPPRSTILLGGPRAQ